MSNQTSPPLSAAQAKAVRTQKIERGFQAMAAQLVEIMAQRDGPFRRKPPKGFERGIDYYSAKDLTMVLAIGAAVYHEHHGVYPQLTKPLKLTEKIFWAKFFRPMKVPEAGNKLLLAALVPPKARSMVEIPEIVWRSTTARLPESAAIDAGTYYLKTNHGSDMFRRIEWPPSDSERQDLETEFAGHLGNETGHVSGEWWYLKFEREIFLERSVSSDINSIAWCCYTFGEKVVRIIAYRKTPQGPQSFWMHADFTPDLSQFDGKPQAQFDLPSPRVRAEMVNAARAIGRCYSFVRVDFLLGDDEQLYLSELTFSPANGQMRWPKELDLEFGALWNHEMNPQA